MSVDPGLELADEVIRMLTVKFKVVVKSCQVKSVVSRIVAVKMKDLETSGVALHSGGVMMKMIVIVALKLSASTKLLMHLATCGPVWPFETVLEKVTIVSKQVVL